MTENKYRQLKYLLGCYFHQDMDLDYNTSEEALKAYTFQTPNYLIESALTDIEKLKYEHLSSEELWHLIEKFGCEYRYEEYNNAPEKWLNYVSNVIKKYLVEKQKLEEREDHKEKI